MPLQMVEHTNRVALALGNSFPPCLYSDPTTTDNPATVAAISAISVDAFGVVTVTTSVPHGLLSSPNQAGSSVLIQNVFNIVYNGAFPVLQIVSPTQYIVRNLAAIGAGASSGGTSTTTAVIITSTFVPAFPTWSATTAFSTNSVVTPTVAIPRSHAEPERADLNAGASRVHASVNLSRGRHGRNQQRTGCHGQ